MNPYSFPDSIINKVWTARMGDSTVSPIALQASIPVVIDREPDQTAWWQRAEFGV